MENGKLIEKKKKYKIKKSESTKYKREAWLDFIKIIAIMLVVNLHTVCYGLNKNILSPHLFIYYIGTFAIPLFFMVNGYLQLRREVTYEYILTKIIKIIYVAFIWNLIIVLLRIILTGSYSNPIIDTIKSFMQIGYFYQFWFLGSLILIYLILPLLSKLINRSVKIYKFVLIILFIITVFIDIFNIYNCSIGNNIIKETVIQTFRLWTWLLYFCIGGYISKFNILEKISSKSHLIFMIAAIVVTICYEYLFALRLYGSLYAENFYDSIIVILTSIIIFTYFKKVNFKNERLISKLGALSMGIYIIHLSVINVLRIFIPLSNSIMNIVVLICAFLISMGFAYIISEIPKVNTLIKL